MSSEVISSSNESHDGFSQLVERITRDYELSLNQEAIDILSYVYNKYPDYSTGQLFWEAKLESGKRHDVTALSSLDPEVQSAIAALRVLYNRHINNK